MITSGEGAHAEEPAQPSLQARWDRKYADSSYFFGTEPNDFLLASEPLIPRRGTVLCLGDGEGRNGVWLARQGYQVHTVDASVTGAAKARRLAEEHAVSIDAEVAELQDWVETEASRGPWDAIVSIFCHLPPDVRSKVGWALSPRLSEAGVLIIESYTPAQIGRGTGGPPAPELMLTSDLVHHDWPGLDLHVVEIERKVREGHGHTGKASVLQAIGRPSGRFSSQTPYRPRPPATTNGSA